MDILCGLLIACSMYSKIPVPQVEWKPERMKYVFCFFPLIGAVIGGCIILLGWVAERLAVPQLALACFGTAIPIILTGGIHLDGFIDTSDARSSYGDREKRLEILKDPHIGAFAVIKAISYFLLYAGAFTMLAETGITALGAVFVITRALSGLSVVCFPKAKDTGLAALFSQRAEKMTVCLAMLVYLAAGVIWLWINLGLWTVVVLVTGVTVYGYYYHISVKEFGGITGDLAGYFLQICELAMLLAIAVGGLAVS